MKIGNKDLFSVQIHVQNSLFLNNHSEMVHEPKTFIRFSTKLSTRLSNSILYIIKRLKYYHRYRHSFIFFDIYFTRQTDYVRQITLERMQRSIMPNRFCFCC